MPGHMLARPGTRRERLWHLDPAAAALVDRLLVVAATGLPGMVREDGVCCHTRRFSATGVVAPPEGWSLRHTAIAALGARHLDDGDQRRVLAGRTAAELCAVLVERLSSVDYVGDAALAVRAAAGTAPAQLDRALRRLDGLDADDGPRHVVALAWTLDALVAARSLTDVEARLDRTRARLLGALTATGLFRSASGSGLVPAYRAHVGAFGAQAFAIQALARLHASADDPRALRAAERCAGRLRALQGPAGQWWWHYDTRTGAVVEGYPVYGVHQHALAPMALLDLAEAGGDVDPAGIVDGLAWLARPPEVDSPLVLDGQALIVRKVGRGHQRKLVRGLRAAATGVRPGLRLGLLDRVWPPTAVDRECRPDELGWLLDCWLTGQRAGQQDVLDRPSRTN